MESKKILLTEEVYEKLNRMKKENESISDAVERIVCEKGKKRDLVEYFGVLKNSEKIKELEEDVTEIRQKSKHRT